LRRESASDKKRHNNNSSQTEEKSKPGLRHIHSHDDFGSKNPTPSVTRVSCARRFPDFMLLKHSASPFMELIEWLSVKYKEPRAPAE
jgi:hypothetical protein